MKNDAATTMPWSGTDSTGGIQEIMFQCMEFSDRTGQPVAGQSSNLAEICSSLSLLGAAAKPRDVPKL